MSVNVIRLTGLALLLASGVAGALAQSDGEFPPRIESVTFSRTSDCATPFNPGVDCLLENEFFFICLTISDRDWAPDPNADPNNPDTEEKQGLAIAMRSYWTPFYDGVIRYGPEPPPVPTDAWGIEAREWYYFPPPAQGDTTTVVLPYLVPEFVGRNQARLRGVINYDVSWVVEIYPRNGDFETPPEPDSVGGGIAFRTCALENPLLASPNPPPFADAGGTQTVLVGSTVTLDASRSFDGTNVGFRVGSPNVLDQDRLNYAWEWISGPVRVDPVEDGDGNPATAQVTLSVPSTPDNPYVYRVLVDDNANAVPTAAVVTIHVRTTLPRNRAPLAVAVAPIAAVPLGATIELNAAASNDPDGDRLAFRWRQTNAVGRDLAADQIQTGFQAVSGIETAVSRWRAVREGTYYFRLLVRDLPELRDPVLTGEGLSDTAFLTVQVAGQAAGATATSDGTAAATDAALEGTPLNNAFGGLCGAGMAPIALLPVFLLFLRGRIR